MFAADKRCYGSPQYAGRSSSHYFPRPYLDYTSTAMPASLDELWDWSEFAYWSTAEIRELFRRMFNYFITPIKVRAVDQGKQRLTDDDVRQWKRTLEMDMKLLVEQSTTMANLAVYGNDFVSVIAPIQRFLICPHCTHATTLEHLAEQTKGSFIRRGRDFLSTCVNPVCRKAIGMQTVKFITDDRKIKEPSKFTVKHWPVREIVLDYYTATEETRIYWKIPEHYKRAVRQNDIKTLATADLSVLEAIDKNVLFEFGQNRVFHAKEPTLSGLDLRGWGLPRSFFLIRQAWTLQLIRKQWQAQSLDFINPIRLVSPANTGVSGQDKNQGYALNPTAVMSHDSFARQIASIRAAHRRDPTQLHTTQVPVEYRLLGGEANQLFPAALHAAAKEDLVDAGGFPINMYKSDLQAQGVEAGIRLFEAQNHGIPVLLNAAAQFTADRVAELTMRDNVQVTHERVTLADSLEIRMAKMQMATSGQLSRREALEPMDIDVKEDLDRQTAEQQMMLEAQQAQQDQMMRMQTGQQEMSNAMQGAAGQQPPAAGSGGGGGGQDAPVDPYAGMLPSTGFVPPVQIDQIEEAAVSLADTLSTMDHGSRQRELGLLRDRYKVFHSVVMQKLKEVRYQQGVAGREQMLNGGM